MKQQKALHAVANEDFLGVWTWNVRTRIVVACRDVCHYANIPSEMGIHGVSTERFYAAIHPDDHAVLDQRVDQALRGDDAFSAEYRLVSAKYGTVRVRSIGRCFRDPSGNPSHISGYLSRIDPAPAPQRDDETILTEVIEHLTHARDAAAGSSKPILSKLIDAVLLEAGFQLANLLRRN